MTPRTKFPEAVRSKILRRVMLIAAIATVSAILLVRHQSRSTRAAEEHALEFVLLNGYISDGYSSNRLRRLLAPLLGSSRIGTTPQRTVAFPINRLTDDMAMSLADIRHLHDLILYPPDLDGSGVDFSATTFTQCASLRDLDVPLSESAMAIIEERCPDLVIQVAARPEMEPASATKAAE